MSCNLRLFFLYSTLLSSKHLSSFSLELYLGKWERHWEVRGKVYVTPSHCTYGLHTSRLDLSCRMIPIHSYQMCQMGIPSQVRFPFHAFSMCKSTTSERVGTQIAKHSADCKNTKGASTRFFSGNSFSRQKLCLKNEKAWTSLQVYPMCQWQ